MDEKSSVIQFPTFSDNRGDLTVAESPVLPFVPQRVFWITKPEGIRGNHAHKECRQVVVAAHGKFHIETSDGADFWLISPFFGLYVPPLVQVTLSEWSSGAVALVLCSEKYDAEDYVQKGDQYV